MADPPPYLPGCLDQREEMLPALKQELQQLRQQVRLDMRQELQELRGARTQTLPRPSQLQSQPLSQTLPRLSQASFRPGEQRKCSVISFSGTNQGATNQTETSHQWLCRGPRSYTLKEELDEFSDEDTSRNSPKGPKRGSRTATTAQRFQVFGGRRGETMPISKTDQGPSPGGGWSIIKQKTTPSLLVSNTRIAAAEAQNRLNPTMLQTGAKKASFQFEVHRVDEACSLEPPDEATEFRPESRNTSKGSSASMDAGRHPDATVTTLVTFGDVSAGGQVASVVPVPAAIKNISEGTEELESEWDGAGSPLGPLPTIYSERDLQEPSWRGRSPSRLCRDILRHAYFDWVSASLIVANGITMGVQCDYTARNPHAGLPAEFRQLEYCFFSCFTLELSMRLCAHGCRFFVVPGWRWNTPLPGWKWNLLDFVVVSTQFLETLLTAFPALLDSEDMSSVSIMRTMRIFRLLRSIRVVRILKYLDDLRTVLVSVMSAFKPLCSTLALIVLILYMAGICFTEMTLLARIDSVEAEQEFAGLSDSLLICMLRLFQTVTGGMEWRVFAEPLMSHISPVMGLVFAMYIVFMNLAIMNIVTGVFVEAASQRSKKEKDVFMVNNLRELFTTLDLTHDGEISWVEFQKYLDDPRMISFFKDIDLDISEAEGLFMLLDVVGRGSLGADDFLSGCLNLRGPARSLDMQLLMREVVKMHATTRESFDGVVGNNPSGDVGSTPVMLRSSLSDTF